ncbi:putative ATP-dependent protease subunit C (ClpC) [Reticulomyxa filosa]|uniref:Putative ATP-dependent protease subunit C (ClpC) n=1 Tax=Reticulomyxa filosa TaxID=46433 RepID=X6M2J7_RETFI|nr:putative ATP-dependent protease subunit C (ClpC) [Reticulomyxa filosa]|eukprot:ETO07647.1 putative ATP-dependent protease subunit C (ClpC) [Reticulomyxa filosa]
MGNQTGKETPAETSRKEGKESDKRKTQDGRIARYWNDKENESKVRQISVRGEAGSGKSVLSQRIAYLWRNDRMWNHQFQYLLHIPLRKIINAYHHINDNSDDQKKDESNDDIEYLWSMIINELYISQWNLNDTKCIINSMNELLLLLDGFDEIAIGNQ